MGRLLAPLSHRPADQRDYRHAPIPHTPTHTPQEDDYEDDDEYEEVFAEGAGGSGVEALDDDGGAAAGDEEEDEDEEDGEQGAYDDEEDEEDDEEGAAAAGPSSEDDDHAEEDARRGALLAALALDDRSDPLMARVRRAAEHLRPARLLATAGEGVSRATRLVCRLEDVGAFGLRFARRFAARAARPALVALVAHRALRTIAQSQSPCVRVGRLPASRQQAYMFERAMGRNWRALMRQDMLEAIAEVDEGLNTEEVDAEKRAYQAAILRRLEVEEWHKERMRHYYYGLYGLGPWYWDMEERLHNPLFISSRGWNRPVEAWVGRNKVFRRDVVRSARTGDAVSDALKALGEQRGAPVPDHVARRVKQRETLSPGDALLTDPAILQVLGARSHRETRSVAAARASEAEVALKAREELEGVRERRRREREAEEARLARA